MERKSLTLNLLPKCLIMAGILSCFFLNSCKKEVLQSQNEVKLESLKPTKGSPFLDTLFQKMLSYNLKSPVLDTVAGIGKIKWDKQLMKLSSGSRSLVTLVYPIVQADSLCKTALEVSISSQNVIQSLPVLKYMANKPSADDENRYSYEKVAHFNAGIIYHCSNSNKS